MKNRKQIKKLPSFFYYVRQIICSAPACATRLTVWYTFSKNAIRNIYRTIFMINYILIVFYVILLLLLLLLRYAMRNFFKLLCVYKSPQQNVYVQTSSFIWTFLPGLHSAIAGFFLAIFHHSTCLMTILW